MAKRDDLLQRYLDLLETGMPLEEVLGQLSHADLQLRQSLILAAAMRSLPPPPIDPTAARKQDAIIQAFIQSRVRSQARPFSINLYQWWLHMRWSLVGASAVLFLLGVAIIFSIYTLRGPVQSLTVIQVNGQAEVSSDKNPDRWLALQTGDKLSAGQRLRTGSRSSIMLRFPDESQLTLAHNTEVSINTLSRQREDALAVELTQHTGNTRHTVTPRQNQRAAYVVHTPTSDTYVQGTTFSVTVADDGRAFIAVEEGVVSVIAGSEKVALTAGFATYTQAGQRPASPVYAFYSQGKLQRADGATWQVDDVMVQVTDETILDQDLKSGDYVLVTGRILPNGRWLADTVESVQNVEHHVTFTGVLVAMSGDVWLVDDVSLLITADTERPTDLVQGDLVRITHTNLGNGRRLALRIDRLTRPPVLTGVPVQFATAELSARPSLSFEPDELEAGGCETTYALTGFLANSGEPPRDVAANVELGYTLLTGAQFIDAVTIDPANWQAIAAGETVSFTLQVDLNTAWLEAPPETEVKLRLFIAAESNRPAHHVTRLTITLVQTCDPPTRIPTATPTPDQSATPTSTPTPFVLAPTNTPVPPPPPPTSLPKGGDCTGVSPHPEGARLAQVYGVPYAEIIGWFCDGFGFGEIDLAYRLSRDTGTPVADIFAMRRQGLDWDEIMQALGVLPGPPATPGIDPTAVSPGPIVSVTPGNPSATPEPTEEPDDGPPIVPPGPSVTPPIPPTPPGGRP